MKKSASLLLIEDNPDDVLFFRRGAEKAGVADCLRVATDGEEAVAYLEGRGSYQDRALFPLPALIVLDLKLPQKWGVEVLTWIRKEPRFKNLPVIILTSSKEPSDMTQTRNLGIVAYHQKSVDSRDLAGLIKVWISLYM